MIQPDLRPLGIGEIFDRAVTLFVRRFAVLVLILAVVAIPVAICQYIAQPQTSAALADFGRLLAVPPGHTQESRAILRELVAKNRLGQSGVAILLIAAILGTLSTSACVIAIAQAYTGKLPSVREVYREALRRWLVQLVALAVFFGLAFALIVGLAIVVFFVALGVGALAAFSVPVATIVGIPVAVILVVAMFAVVALIYFAAELSFIAIALEEPNAIRGIAHGLRRTFSPPIFWRSLLTATIVLGVTTVGGLLITAIAAGLSAVTHLTALYPVVAVVGGVALNALVTTFVVLYAVDVRVRREGYDLALAAQAPAL